MIVDENGIVIVQCDLILKVNCDVYGGEIYFDFLGFMYFCEENGKLKMCIELFVFKVEF